MAARSAVLLPAVAAGLSSAKPAACRHLAFAVDDVARCKAELEAHGVAVEEVRVDRATGRRFVFFADPDGLPTPAGAVPGLRPRLRCRQVGSRFV